MTTEHIDSREVERLNDAISKLRDAALKQVEFQNSLIYQLKHTSRQRDQLLEALKEIVPVAILYSASKTSPSILKAQDAIAAVEAR